MGKSVLVFISHSSEDKKDLIKPIVADLEDCFINVWLDNRKILPGDNLRKSIFKDGLDKADIALIFFTENSLKSSWVDKEIKHVLRDELKKGNDFDLNKIISIFDSKETYEEITNRYPELTDDLMHLMPINYSKIQLGQLISAIWSKYLSLQGGDIETQKQLLMKEKEIFRNEKEIENLKSKINDLKSENSNSSMYSEFEKIKKSGQIDNFINNSHNFLSQGLVNKNEVKDLAQAISFELAEIDDNNRYAKITKKGKDFFKWLFLMYN